MSSNQSIQRAVLAILGSTTAVVGLGSRALAANAGPEATVGLEEIVVTATRRSENLQNVPISIQALTGDTLEKLNVATISDFVKYLPNVQTANLGPGQGTLYMRGLSVGTLGTQGQGSVGFFPNVAVYLDEQSASLPGRNLDIYAVDMERVEVLEGPQGTLFGAGAQAGVMRFITNKPKLNVTEGNVSGGFSTTAQGKDNGDVNATLNIPLIDDKMAARVVVYSDSRGGYIDNVASTFTRHPDGYYIKNATYMPKDTLQINNYDSAASDINPITYKGIRASALYKINDDWDALLAQSYQTMEAQGVFYQMPKGSEGQTLQPLQVTLFNPSSTTDDFSNTALTVNGKFGDFRFIYAGAYLSRNVEQIQDYTNYARGPNGNYYQCAGYANYKNWDPTGEHHKDANGVPHPVFAVTPGSGHCYSPATSWHDKTFNSNFSNEMRLSTPDDWRLRGLVGVYYSKQEVNDQTDWLYRAGPVCTGPANKGGIDSNCWLQIDPFVPGSPYYGASVNNPNPRNSHTGFFDDFQRTLTQTAAFASADFDLIPKTLTLTFGTRYFDIKNKMLGANVGSFYCKAGGVFGFNVPGYTTAGGAPATTTTFVCKDPYGTNLNTQDPNQNTATGFKSRANLSWKITPDMLVYGTWSEGFRPGGFNRGTSCHVKVNGVNQWCIPIAYNSDDLTNLEAGWKTELFEHRLQFNGALYQETWKNVQTGIFRPQDLGNLTVGLNGPEYRVRGIEAQFVVRVTAELTLLGSAAWNSSELTNSPSLKVNNPPNNPNAGDPITSIQNPYGTPGSPLANSPPFAANMRARYEFNFNNYHAFWQFGFAHQGHSYSSATSAHLFDQPGWTVFDASIGIAKDAWQFEFVGENISNQNKSLFTTDTQFVRTETPMRPRTLGIRMSYHFSGNGS